MKKKIVLTLSVLAAACCVNLAHAINIPTSLSVSDPHIEVGETFDVTVTVNLGNSALELLAWSFDVDPLGALSHISYLGATLSAPFIAQAAALADVAGDVFPGVNLAGPVNLAVLRFSADSVGNDILEIEGLFDGLFQGAFVADPNPPFETFDYDIAASIAIEVHERAVRVPDSSFLALELMFALAGFCALARRFRR